MTEVIVPQEEIGIKETKEAMIALAKLGKFIAAQARDGLDVKDVAALAAKIVSDEAFRAALIEGFEGAAKIPAEIKDLKFNEGIELSMALIGELKAA
jgi:hypothetical protein